MLKVSLGQHSSAGEKTLNQDSHGAHLPLGSSLQFKGAVVALADGISSSPVSDKASQTAISQFLHDYYCTSDSWSVTHAGEQVIQTINRSLLNSTKTSKYWENTDHGYVCTFSALVAKHRQGYLFHVGDSRIYRWRQYQLEQLTRDHRQWHEERFFLSNALGLHESVAIDTREVALEEEDIDFFDDPDKAVSKAIENHPKFRQFEEQQKTQHVQVTTQRLKEAHPDYVDIVSDSKFQEWVQESPIRKQLFVAAHNYNLDSALELIGNWKERALISNTSEAEANKAVEREQAMKAGKGVSRTSSESTSGKKIYRRADLIRLKTNDPERYESLQDEILAAYAEGRVK